MEWESRKEGEMEETIKTNGVSTEEFNVAAETVANFKNDIMTKNAEIEERNARILKLEDENRELKNQISKKEYTIKSLEGIMSSSPSFKKEITLDEEYDSMADEDDLSDIKL